MKKDIEEVVITEKEIDQICSRLGKEITNDYKDISCPLLVGLLKGCLPFMADLARYIEIPLNIDYMAVSSYDGAMSSGSIHIKKDLDTSVFGRDVIIAEDIVDTGRTLNTVVDLLKHRGAKSVEVVTLLDKPEGRIIPFTPKYVGGKCPNKFVVGYGLDFNEVYRNLPYIGVLKKEVYEEESKWIKIPKKKTHNQ